MRAEREKLNAKITAGALKLSGGRLELPAEMCHIVLFSGGSCTVQCGDMSLLVSPGCALLLGPGAWVVSQAGHTQPEMLGCEFPLAVLHEMKNATGEDFLRLFAPGSQMALYGSVQWASRLRTLLEMMRGAMGEPEYPGGLYLALTLHYVEQEHRAQSAADARPRNETVEQICAYLAANYQQKLSLTEVAARFYISPYYLSRLFRRVTGQWNYVCLLVDLCNGEIVGHSEGPRRDARAPSQALGLRALVQQLQDPLDAGLHVAGRVQGGGAVPPGIVQISVANP